jgi:hypothetical protein
MEPLTVFALTSFLFIHIITIGFVVHFFIQQRRLRDTLVEFSQSVNTSLQRLQQLILSSPLGMAGLLQGGAPPAEGAPGIPPADPDEDDDITTLGEMLGE